MNLSKKKFLILLINLFIFTIMLEENRIYATASSMQNDINSPIKAAVLLYNEQDIFVSVMKKQFEDIQNQNKDKVIFTIYDGKNNQELQNKTIDKILKDQSADVIMLNLVDPETAKSIVNKIKNTNIPVILFNREPKNMDDIKSYNKAYYVGANENQAGSLEGKIIADLWKENKKLIDINGDNVLQYIMLRGPSSSKIADSRSKYSVYAINDAGIQTNELVTIAGNWTRETTKLSLSSLLLSNINRLEAIISNNDDMAIGAIESLQMFGYNKGAGSKTIPVVGIDAISDAQELIKKGEMAGTVSQQYPQIAETCYLIGINLVNHKEPLEGIEYKFDGSGVAVRIPYERYIP